ncbi:MAG: FAD-dependent oxidoreductase, partial [Kiritimatiellae bacterium]|nr:FAD-dependent oxidoreductase [Kiritimatiellia bacterium]
MTRFARWLNMRLNGDGVSACARMGLVIGIIFFSAVTARAAAVLVEAETFVDHGGWTLEQQFIDQMGSSYLMAHGLGAPVHDASTVIQLPEAGMYRVLARTKNWGAPWNRADAPGKFMIAVNGKDLPQVLGTKEDLWAWQAAGTANLPAGEAKLVLRDLTGFNGRCDAIILTSDPTFMPPNDLKGLDRYRRDTGAITPPTGSVKTDFIIVGGGIPGICAAITAARLGLRVTLVHDRPVLGGNNSSEVRVHLGGRANLAPYPKLGDLVREIGPARGGNARPADFYEDGRKHTAVEAEKNITLMLNTRGLGVEMDGSRIKAVIARDVRSGKETRLTAPLVLDSTGDGAIGVLAGADFRMGREGRDETGEPTAPEQADALVMGSSVQWYSVESDSPTAFPDIAWGLVFNEETCERVKMGEWTWETGMNRNPIDDFEHIRDYGLLVVFSNWSFLKNRSKHKQSYAKSRLEWVAHVAGKRESRRLIGDHVLREQDLIERTVYPDATACTTWTIDLHYPDPKNTADFPCNEFKSIAKHRLIYPYPIPYRCFYSKNVENLFMAGRNISVTHVALGTARLMRTGGMMGEVVGMAATLCKRHNCQPRDIFTSHLNDLKTLMAA